MVFFFIYLARRFKSKKMSISLIINEVMRIVIRSTMKSHNTERRKKSARQMEEKK